MHSIIAYLRRDLWSPYLAGALLGLVAVASMVFADHTVGASGAFQNIAAYLGVELTSTETTLEGPAPAAEPAADAGANSDAAFWGDAPASSAAAPGSTTDDSAFWGEPAADAASEPAADDSAFWGADPAASAAADTAPIAAAPAAETVTVARDGLERQFSFFAYTMPKGISWMVWLLVGIFFGAMISSVLSGGFRLSLMPHSEQWRAVFGPRVWKRWAMVFLGGIVIALAAGIAGGCTSGLAIAKGVQLSPAAFLFIMGMFITGPLAALVAYRGRF